MSYTVTIGTLITQRPRTDPRMKFSLTRLLGCARFRSQQRVHQLYHHTFLVAAFGQHTDVGRGLKLR